MNSSIYRINLDVHKAVSQAVINVKQYDNARHLIFTFSEDGKPFDLSGVHRAVLRAKKPDGTELYNDCVIVGNTVTYNLTTQTSAAVGIVVSEITLYDEEYNRITSPGFSIRVMDSSVTDDEIESTDEFTALTVALSEAEEAIVAAEAANTAAEAANEASVLANTAAATATDAAATATSAATDVATAVVAATNAATSANAAASAANTATTGAENATAAANIATGAANEAATAANAAAADATAAAVLATTKAGLADAASGEASSAASAANAAALSANTAKTAAENAASAANTAAGNVSAAIATANSAAAAASGAASDAQNAASAATSAATTANTKAELADAAATLATTKAGLAENAASAADTATATANSAASAATAAASAASSAASDAGSAATAASNAASSATSAAGSATTAASNAETSASAANSAASDAASAASAAASAASSASSAAAAANTAAAGAANVDASVEQTATGATIYITGRDGVTHSAHIDTSTTIDGWDDIKYAVRNGLAPTLFPVGYEFTTWQALSTTAAVRYSSSISIVSFDETTFWNKVSKVPENSEYVYYFAYDGTTWNFNQTSVPLGDYGITITGTPASADVITVTVTAIPLTWAVRDHNNHEATNSLYHNTMTLELKHIYSGSDGACVRRLFSQTQALYYCSEGLPAGTYHFWWDDNGTSSAYQFTLGSAIPVGGQIVLTGINFNASFSTLTGFKIATYGSIGSTTAIESNIAITSGYDGVELGIAFNYHSSDSNLNCAYRAFYGSNNYAQSAIRQWLNSNGTANQTWVPTTKFDRPPVWFVPVAGFMRGLGGDFLSAVQSAKIPCRTTSKFEVDSLDGTSFPLNEVYWVNDKFFLLSRPEVYGTYNDDNIRDGELLAYYDGLSDPEKVKYSRVNVDHRVWLRSPSTTTTNQPYQINDTGIAQNPNDDGSLTGFSAGYNMYTVTPACIIA